MPACYNAPMPSKRNTYGLDACTQYSLRVCGDKPCQYHRYVDEAKQRGISLKAYVDYRRAQDDERSGE